MDCTMRLSPAWIRLLKSSFSFCPELFFPPPMSSSAACAVSWITKLIHLNIFSLLRLVSLQSAVGLLHKQLCRVRHAGREEGRAWHSTGRTAWLDAWRYSEWTTIATQQKLFKPPVKIPNLSRDVSFMLVGRQQDRGVLGGGSHAELGYSLSLADACVWSFCVSQPRGR